MSTGTGKREKVGYMGLIGSIFFLFAFLSMVWASIDPDMTVSSWFALSVQLIGGTALAVAFGFQFRRRVPLSQEIDAVVYGVFAGIISIGIMNALLLLQVSPPYSTYSESIWLVVLAPVAETMAFIVAVNELIRFHFPEVNWTVLALASDISFAFYHYFAYSALDTFVLILIILMIGNTLLFYVYHLTRNATAPIIGHLLINLAAVKTGVLVSLLFILPTFLLVFVILFILYIILGGLRQ